MTALKVLFLVAIVFLTAHGLAQEGWYAIDFQSYFRPAALALDPYSVEGFYNPPWTAWLMWPFAILPPTIGQALMFTVALATIGAVLRRMQVPILGTFLILTSYPVIYSLAYGNLEWLVLLGLLLPKPIGMILLMVKPQLGIGIALWWIWDTWREDGIGDALAMCVPLGLVALGTAWVYNWRPWMMLGALPDVDADIWPYGLLLVPLVLRHRKAQYVLGPLVSPHLTRGSWIGLLLTIADSSWLLAAANVVSWAIGLGAY